MEPRFTQMKMLSQKDNVSPADRTVLGSSDCEATSSSKNTIQSHENSMYNGNVLQYFNHFCQVNRYIPTFSYSFDAGVRTAVLIVYKDGVRIFSKMIMSHVDRKQLKETLCLIFLQSCVEPRNDSSKSDVRKQQSPKPIATVKVSALLKPPPARNIMKRGEATPRSSRVTGITGVGTTEPTTQVDNTRETAELNRDMATDDAANVQLTDTTVPSKSEVATTADTSRKFINELPATLSSLGDRWCKFLTFQWSSADNAGAIVQRIDLPITMLQNARCAPNTLLFDQYAYFKTDMRLKIQINTNPGQSGMLIAGVMYNASNANAAGIRIEDSAQLIQMPHVRLNAASSNTGELHVPWVFQLPVISTRNTPVSRGSYYYTLFFGILGQLRSGAEGVSTANVVVYGTFENLQFYGQRTYREVVPRSDRVIFEATPRMDLVSGLGALQKGADLTSVENMLSKLELPNCDRPQRPVEPVTIYPQQNTSLSLGTGTNEVKLLQLLHDNTCPHPKELVPSDNQFSSNFIKRQWGKIRQFQWSTSSNTGTELATIAVSPMQQYTPSNGVSFPTPLAGLGSFYAGYHGDMEIRLTFFISKFHSGRISITYTPDAYPADVNDACYYSSVVDIQDQSEVMFTIPYQVPTLYAVHKGRIREWDLILNDTDIGAGTLLRYPSFGVVRIAVVNPLRANPTAAQTIEVLIEMRGGNNFHYVMPVGTDFRVPNSNTPGLMARAKKLNMLATPRSDTKDVDERSKMITGKPKMTEAMPTWYTSINERYEIRDVVKRYTPICNIQSSGLAGLSPTTDPLRNALISVYYVPSVPIGLEVVNPVVPILTPLWRQIPGAVAFGRSLLVARERINMDLNSSISFRVPWNSNMSMLANGVDPTSYSASMQTYCNGRVNIVITFNYVEPGETQAKPYNALLAFDVTAGTIGVRDNSEQISYNMLDVVSYMHDGFRFFRGDLNYQLDIIPYFRETGWDFATVIHRAFGDTANFYVFQGFPRNDHNLEFVNVLSSSALTRTGDDSLSMWANPTLGILASESGWKRDLTEEGVEPNPGPALSTIRDSTCRAVEAIGKVCGINDPWDFLVRQVPRLRRILIVAAASHLSHTLAIAIMVEYLYYDIKSSVTNVASTATSIDKLINPKTTEESIDRAMHLVELATYVTNIYNSNGAAQTCLNIACLLNKFGLAKIMIDRVTGIFSSCDDVRPGIVPRSEEEDLSSSWFSLVISGIFAALGFSTQLASKFECKNFMNTCRDFFKDGFHIKKFFDSHITLLSKVVDWIKEKLGLKNVKPQDVPADVIAWMEQVNYYCEQYNLDVIIDDPRVAREIFELRRRSNEFDALFVEMRTPVPPNYYAYKNKLNKIIDTLAKSGCSEPVRPTPFCMWMYGTPGIGKSRIADVLLVEAGKQLGVVSSRPVYARTSDTTFWNGYQQQPLILYPDFAKNQTSQQYALEVNEFMSLVDVWPFNPSFAELEDKRRIVRAEAVLVCSNFAFPNITNIGNVETTAFYRRRHCLFEAHIPDEVVAEVLEKHGIDINVTLDNKIFPMANRIPTEWFASNPPFAHLRFRMHEHGNARTHNSVDLTFEEFLPVFKRMLASHRARELQYCQQQRHLYSQLTPDDWKERLNELPRRVDEEAQAGFRSFREAAPRNEVPRPSELRFGCAVQAVIERYGIVPGSFQKVNVSTGSVEECGCDFIFSNNVLKYYTLCDHSKRKVRSALEPECLEYCGHQTNWEGWQGRIPTMFELGFKTVPGSVVKWEDYTMECPHNEYVLSNAYFCVVKGRVEVVVDAPDQSLTYILPSVCMPNTYECVKRIPGMPAQGTYAGTPEANFEPDKAPVRYTGRWWLCKADRRELRFVMDGEIMKVAIRGTVQNIVDPQTQADVLNQLMTRTFPSGTIQSDAQIDAVMTFFYFRRRQEVGALKVMTLAFKKYSPIIIEFLGAAFAIFSLYASFRLLYSFWKGSQAANVEGRAAYAGGKGASMRGKNRAVNIPTIISATPQDQQLDVENFVANNTITLVKNGTVVEGLRVCSTFVLCPRHFIESGGDFQVEMANMRYPVSINGCQHVNFENENGPLDLSLINIPILPAARNILGHFINQAEATAIKSKSVLIYKQRTHQVFNSEIVEITPDEGMLHYVSGPLKNPVNFVGYKWSGRTEAYRCGAILTSNKRMIGMYVADNRSEGVGFAVCLYRQMVVEALRKLGATTYDMKLHRYNKVKAGNTQVPVGENMIPMSVLDDPVTYSGKTALEPSPITEAVAGPFLFPAEQRGDHEVPGVGVVAEAANKQVKPVELPIKIFKVVSLFFVQKILSCKPDLANVKRPFTFTEAVNGIDDVRFPSMNLNTALGWPFKDLVPHGWKKKNVIDRDNQVVDKRLVDYYVQNNTKRKKLEIPDTAFMDFPKDETLKPEKATRLINGCPIDLFIDMRRYLSQFFVCVRNPLTGIQVGIDVHSFQWAESMSIIDNPIDEDYKNFGLTWHTQILRLIRDVAIAWNRDNLNYSEDDLKVVYTIFEELASAHHVCYDLKYHVLCGSPSGAFGTDALNSLANLFYQMYDHYLQFGNFDRWGEERLLIYGDDLRRNRLRSHVSFKKNMEDIGMIVEEDKTGKSFLKRRVNLADLGDGYVALAPLPPHVLVDVLHWLRKPYFSSSEQLQQRVTAFLQEAAHYGEPTYVSLVNWVTKNVWPEMGKVEYAEIMKQRYGLKRLSPVQHSKLIELDCRLAQADVSHFLLDIEFEGGKNEFDQVVFDYAQHVAEQLAEAEISYSSSDECSDDESLAESL